MDSNELFENYVNIHNQRVELEDKIESFTKKWESGEYKMKNETVQETMEKAYDRLAKLKNEEKRIGDKWMYESMRQMQNKERKKHADISVRHHLGENPTDISIVGGVLSSDANESHLVAEIKSSEQLENEKQQMLSDVKSKVSSNDISLAEASKLVDDINTSYDFYSNNQKTSGGHK